MVATDRARVYGLVKIASAQMGVPLSKYKRYRKTSRRYWKRLWFLLQIEIVSRCFARRQALDRLCYYLQMHVLKFLSRPALCG